MGKEIRFTLKRGSDPTEEEIAMIEEAGKKPPVYDEDNPDADPVTAPEQYKALMRAVAERNRRIAGREETGGAVGLKHR